MSYFWKLIQFRRAEIIYPYSKFRILTPEALEIQQCGPPLENFGDHCVRAFSRFLVPRDADFKKLSDIFNYDVVMTSPLPL